MRQTHTQGLIGILLIIIIAILAISYFNIDLKSLVEKPTTQQNMAYVTDTSSSIWNKYLEKPAAYLWNTVFVGLIWNSVIDNLTKIKNNQPTDIQQTPPINTTPNTSS